MLSGMIKGTHGTPLVFNVALVFGIHFWSAAFFRQMTCQIELNATNTSESGWVGALTPSARIKLIYSPCLEGQKMKIGCILEINPEEACHRQNNSQPADNCFCGTKKCRRRTTRSKMLKACRRRKQSNWEEEHGVPIT